LVNGFNELTDAKVQLERFQQDNEYRQAMGLIKKPIDQHFILCLSHGLPQCSGVALGVDRLVMLALGSKTIEQVITFPTNRS